MGSSEEAKTILTPILTELRKQREAHNYEKVSEFYDLNAVHVHAGKEAVYGKDAIKEHSKKFIDRSGKLTPKMSNEKFDMAGDFIIFTADYETQTEKIGVLKGKFTQIWRKTNDTYLILHIEMNSFVAAQFSGLSEITDAPVLMTAALIALNN